MTMWSCPETYCFHPRSNYELTNSFAAEGVAIVGLHFHSNIDGKLNAWLSDRKSWAAAFSGQSYPGFTGGWWGTAH